MDNNKYFDGKELRMITELGIPIMSYLYSHYKHKLWWRFWRKITIGEIFEKISNKKVKYKLVLELLDKNGISI